MAEAPVRIENRAQLIYVLSEASELEHGLSCCYQFAAFSLKQGVDEGVTEKQLEAIQRWRRCLLDIAVEEMLHLANASNLLTAVGGSPHLRRPNFPSHPRMYPEGFNLTLTPFSEETIGRFVFVERPEGMLLPDHQVAPCVPPHPLGRPVDIFPGGQVYETVGHLYRAVEDGLRYLADKYGEEGLFLNAAAQTSQYGITPAVDLASAIAAIESIVEQGEGARGDLSQAHFGRFSAVLDEYRALKAEDPAFEPARPVVSNPYSRIPSDVHPSLEVHIIDDPLSVAVCNLFDGCYDALILGFARMFANVGESEAEHRILGDLTWRLMAKAMSPLAGIVTRMPAGPSNPGKTAGPSFHLLRDAHTLPHKRAAWTVLRERLRELYGYSGLLETYANAPPGLGEITSALGELPVLLAED